MGIEKYRCLAAYTSQMGSAIFAYTANTYGSSMIQTQ